MSNMFDRLSKNFMNNQFRRVDNVVWDLSTNQMGILTKDESIAIFSYDSAEGENPNKVDGVVSINPMVVMSMAIPAYGQKMAAANIQVGDITVDSKGDANGWVTEIHTNGKFTIQRVDGSEQKITPPTVNVIGFGEQSGLMVVKPLFNVTKGNTDSVKNMLMQMMMLNDGNVNDSQMDKMMQMMLMSSSMGNSGGDNNMMQAMMMAKMFGSNF